MKQNLLKLCAVLFMVPLFSRAQLPIIERNKVQLTSQAELNVYLKKYPVVVLYVFKEGCPFCVKIKPAMQQLVAEMKNVMFLYVDGDYSMLNGLVNKYAPEGFPEIKIFHNGNVVKSMGDAPTKATIQSAIRRYTEKY